MLRKKSRLLSLLLSILLMFSTFSSASATQVPAQSNPNDESLESFQQAKQEYYDQKYKDHSLSLKELNQEDENVHVIIKLEGKSIVEELNKAGKPLSKESSSALQKREKEIISVQATFIKNVTNKRIPFDMKHQFTYLVNGLSGQVKYGDIEKIKSMPGVIDIRPVNVYQPEEFTSNNPDMYSSAPLIGADYVWETNKYTGEDVIVAIVDTGVNYYHPAFGGTGVETIKLGDKVDRSQITGNKEGYSPRIIGGYNWADGNNDIVDRTTSQHGVHVAGTVAGNDANAQINGQNLPFKGIAYDASILAEKVFSNDPARTGAMADDIIAGMEHAVKNGAGVINMSLGSSNGAVVADDPEIVAVETATNNGVVVAISAGNSSFSTDSYGVNPLEQDRDYSMVGTPSVSPSSISVASSENSATYFEAFTLSKELNGVTNIPMTVAKDAPHPSTLAGENSIAYGGLGKTTDFTSTNVKGKIALILRGDISFSEKVANAAKAGAKAVIVYNREGDNSFVNMDVKVSGKPATIPAVFIRNTDGAALKALLATDSTVQLGFNNKLAEVQLAKDTMSDFSSWGPEPGLHFKPTLTAPGGNIFSSVGANQYAVNSGTSMASPHVAGAAAVIIQSLKERNVAYHPGDIRTLLSNTAKVLINPDTNTPYSVRHQGAGRIQLNHAVETNVAVQYKGEPGAALKEFDSNRVEFSLVAKNFSNADVTYTLSGDAFQDLIVDGVNQLTLTPIENARVTFDSPSVTVQAGTQSNIKVTLSLPNGFEKNQFVDGWITFTADEESGQPNLVVPYFGFYGDWNSVDVIDRHWSDPENVYKSTGLYFANGNVIMNLGMDAQKVYHEEYVAFSPFSGSKKLLVPIFTLLRNAENFEVNILDSNKQKLVELSKVNYIRKHSYDGTAGSLFDDYGIWNGTINGEVAPDGQYYIQAIAKPFGVTKTQEYLYPVKVDTRLPNLQVTENQTDSGTELVVNAADESGIEAFAYELWEDGKGYVTKQPVIVEAVNTDNGFTTKAPLPTLKNNQSAFIYALDYAGNQIRVSTGQSPLVITRFYATPDGTEFSWMLSEEVADVEVLIDFKNPYRVKELFPNWRNEIFVPLLEGRHDITFNALNENDEVLSTFTTFSNGKTVVGKTSYRVTSMPDEMETIVPIEISVVSDLVVKVDVYSGSQLLDTIPTAGRGEYIYNYVAPEGQTKLDLKGYNADGNLTGLRAITVTHTKSHILFSQEKYETENNQTNLPIDVTYSNTVKSADLTVTATGVNKVYPIDLTNSTGNLYSYNLDLTPFAHGDYTLKLTGYDASKKKLPEVTTSLRVIKTGTLSYVEGLGQVRTNQNSYTLNWNVDQADVIQKMKVFENGTPITEGEQLNTYTSDLSALGNNGTSRVTIEAYSETEDVIGKLDYVITKDLQAPEVTITSPVPYAIYKTNVGNFSATSFDSDLAKVTILAEGMEQPVVATLTNGSAGKITIQGTVPITKEGMQNLEIRYTDQAGNEAFINRKVFADFNAPEISLNNIKLKTISDTNNIRVYEGRVTTNRAKYTIAGLIFEGHSSFDLYLNDNQILGALPHKQWTKAGDQRSFTKTVDLVNGENIFTIYVIDGVNNYSQVTLYVTKEERIVDPSVPPVTPPVTPPTTPPSNGEDIDVGKISTEENEDGSKSLSIDVTKEGLSEQLSNGNLGEVTLDLSKLKLDTYKDTSITLAQGLVNDLTKSGKGLVLTNEEFSLSIPVKSFTDFTNKDGITIGITISNEEAQPLTGTESKMVSKVISLQNSKENLTNPITLSIKPGKNLVDDARKIGIYQKQENGTWTYVGSLKNSNGEAKLTTTKLGSYALIEYQTTFSDVTKNWARDEIEVLASHHIIKGKGTGQFAPNDSITRAQFAALIDRILGSEKDWNEYAKISGANSPLGREEMVTMMMKALGVDLSTVEGELTFKDQEMISKDAKAAVLFAVQHGLIKGTSGNLFAPEQTTSRAHAAVVIYRLMVYLDRL
ncbi:S8 family serine peptidase [Pseudoneobacillus sp. C159]